MQANTKQNQIFENESSNEEISFVKLVYKMREAQTEYFTTRTLDSLRTAKALEKRVDNQLKQSQEINATATK